MQGRDSSRSYKDKREKEGKQCAEKEKRVCRNELSAHPLLRIITLKTIHFLNSTAEKNYQLFCKYSK